MSTCQGIFNAQIFILYPCLLFGCFFGEFLCSQFYQISIIFNQIYGTHREALVGWINQDQSWQVSKANERILYTLQISRTEVWPTDAVECHTKENFYYRVLQRTQRYYYNIVIGLELIHHTTWCTKWFCTSPFHGKLEFVSLFN